MAVQPVSYPAEHEDLASSGLGAVSEGHAGGLGCHKRIALACDWLTTPGGAEKVLLELHRMYPDAPIYTSQYREKGIDWFKGADVRTGWLNLFPAKLRKILGPLRQLYFSRLDLTDYDLVISVTGAEAKSLRAKTHLCYCHVPTQYYWQMSDQYLENPGFGFLNPLVRLCFKLLIKPLRQADYKAAQKPTKFITISTYAADQIQRYYHRSSTIIAPPVDISKFSTVFPQEIHNSSPTFPPNSANHPQHNPQKPQNNPQDSPTSPQKHRILPQFFHKKSTDQGTHQAHNGHTMDTQWAHNGHTSDTQPAHAEPTLSPQSLPERPFVIACRQVTWKRVDLAISACLKANRPLLVIGDGPEHKNLVKLARNLESQNQSADNPPLITFIPWLETAALAAYLHDAKAYLFPSLEPFGIAAVEALAAGCPVIAYAAGGSRDFVHEHGPGKNGVLFPEQTVEALAAAIESFDPSTFDPKTVQNSVKNFAPEVFRRKITALAAAAPPTPVSKTPHVAHPAPKEPKP